MGERVLIMMGLENNVWGIKLTTQRVNTDNCCPDLFTHIRGTSSGEPCGLTSSNNASTQSLSKGTHLEHLHTDMQMSSPTDLESSTSMDDGFDKNSQVRSSFSRFVPFQAHAETSRTRIIQGDLEGELLGRFQGECIAVGLSFLLKNTWKE